ncbi:MAG: deoxyribose-phosphate aldolase [Candidatus Aenigmarchaeota archaeon]|nr:deoxyribose-phosphate aldolase [Candidatus Aenigmarchaeota archaeon]
MDKELASIAKMIDHSLLHPTLTDEELRKGCQLAMKYNVASVCIKPYAVGSAVELLKGSEVKVGTVVGFPHGSNKTEIKVQEADLACKEGAAEIDMVVNVGKVLSRDWEYVEREIKEVTEIAHNHGAIIKVIFENDFLPDDEFKIKLCEICERAKVDFVKTSTGYGFIKDKDGKYSYKGATDNDLRLMREHCSDAVQVKAAGKVRTLDDAIRVRSLGATRIGASATETILEEAKRRKIE